MPAIKNLIHESSTTTGTGNFTLAAVNGKVRFSDATHGFGVGVTADVFDYFISNRDAAEWEIGTGHMSAANTLVRDTVVLSSNGNVAVNFAAGTKDVVNDAPAASQFYVGGATLTVGQGGTGQTTAAEALGEMTQALTEDTTPARLTDYVATYDASDDTGKKVALARVAGTALLVEPTTFTTASSVAVVLTGYTGFRRLRFVFANVHYSNDAAYMVMRVSTNGGSSYDAGAGDYEWVVTGQYYGAANPVSVGSSSDTAISTWTTSNASTAHMDIEVLLSAQTSTANHPLITYRGTAVDSTADEQVVFFGGGRRIAAQDTDAIQFLPSAGTFTGTYAVYGDL